MPIPFKQITSPLGSLHRSTPSHPNSTRCHLKPQRSMHLIRKRQKSWTIPSRSGLQWDLRQSRSRGWSGHSEIHIKREGFERLHVPHIPTWDGFHQAVETTSSGASLLVACRVIGTIAAIFAAMKNEIFCKICRSRQLHQIRNLSLFPTTLSQAVRDSFIKDLLWLQKVLQLVNRCVHLSVGDYLLSS